MDVKAGTVTSRLLVRFTQYSALFGSAKKSRVPVFFLKIVFKCINGDFAIDE